MKIYYAGTFINKASIKHYPLQGFWIKLSSNRFTGNGNEYVIDAYQASKFYIANTFIYPYIVKFSDLVSSDGINITKSSWSSIFYKYMDKEFNELAVDGNITYSLFKSKYPIGLTADRCRISFDITDATDKKNRIRTIYLYAIDLTKFYPDIVTNDSFTITERTNIFNTISQTAAVIDMEDNDSSSDSTRIISAKITNILELGYCPQCSFKCNNALDPIGHHNDSWIKEFNENYSSDKVYDHKSESEYYMNGVNPYTTEIQNNNIDNNILINKDSGMELVRETVSYNQDEQLLGNMTIKKSGLIQL